MAIVPLCKMTLYGAESQKEMVIQRLQELGCVHLLNLSTADAQASDQPAAHAVEALKYLRGCPEQLPQVERPNGSRLENVIRQATSLKERDRCLHDELDHVQKAIDDLEPWGDFELPPQGRIRDIRLWFVRVPLADVKKFDSVSLPWREISRDNQTAFVVVLSPDEPDELPGRLVQLDPRPLSELRARAEEIHHELEEIHRERASLTSWCNQLRNFLDAADDAAARQRAARQTYVDNKIFALQGWVPQASVESLRQLADEQGLALTTSFPTMFDNPPTLLKNPEQVAGSESLVTFYKTPAYRSWDPSIISYLSFALFFAMILADAGYGLILAVLTAVFWNRLGKTRNGHRSRNVLATIVAFTVIYGVLCGSYFGLSPGEDTLLGKLKLIDAQSQELMMPLTILIGVVHLSLAHVVMAWLHRRRATALASLGWIAVMLGATLLGIATFEKFQENLIQGLTNVGTVLMIGGLIAVFIFSSSRPLLTTNLKDHAWRVLEGFQGLTGISGLFGDVLSYLRLFALGLSSAKLSETFNSLGASAWNAAGVGAIAAVAIVLLGHTLNLLLSIVSGVVHGLRLNCIEFFKYGLPEEGYLFQSFAKKAREP